MSFSSPGFLFAFMPAVFAFYYVLPERSRNLFLFAASMTFYYVDAGPISYVLLASVFVNQIAALWIRRTLGRPLCQVILTAAVILNLAPLFYFKYWNFFAGSAASVFSFAGGASGFEPLDILLPAGISFFTFQGISYLIDVYRKEVLPTRTTIEFGMYHTLFPQLIAGPIVRYKEVENDVPSRRITLQDVQFGIVLFCFGLGKKIIIADNVGVLADRMFELPAAELSLGAAWLGIVAYTLQIFFDFSGYSDMAIGLGRMLGFRFPENFDQPYRSRSISEFWRRWHMTLSRWFRDYVYIPLGGNRAGPLRTYLNLTIVFALCGLWHGAAYSFLVWGLWHGLLLVLERLAANRFGWKPTGFAGWALTLLLVMIGWVFFRSPSVADAATYLTAMAGLGGQDVQAAAVRALTTDKIAALLAGVALALAPYNFNTFRFDLPVRPWLQASSCIGALGVFFYASMLIASNGFNPFIYFRF